MTAKKIDFSTEFDVDSKYFDELPKNIQKLVRELILEAANNRKGPRGFRRDEDCIEKVECHARDGFTPFEHNKGGLEYRDFTYLIEYWGDGHEVAHKEANKEIQRQIELSFKLLKEHVFNKFKDVLTKHGLKQDNCEYHIINELIEDGGIKELDVVQQEIETSEREYLSDDNSSIMHSIRFMYHGKVNGKHVASISAAINTEGPYHRSHIPWAPQVFCEGAKEVEIEWTTQAELKTKLKKALTQVSKVIF